MLPTIFGNITFDVMILGCGSAVPVARHMTTSQLVCIHDKVFMVDCGEGT
jgi:ribonuclease Z